MVRTFRSPGRVALSMALFGLVAVAPALVARGEDPKTDKAPITAREAFARLKSLAGTWKNEASHGNDHAAASESKVTYRLTGAGSALVETDFPGSNHEMISVYHLDKEDLRLTHYCAAGNQPRMKLDRAASTPKRLVFAFDGGSNLDPAKDMHIHGLTMEFHEGGNVECAWDAYAGGKKVETAHFKLSREKE
ncbi:MAG: hypothetical protein U0790_05135 [Isosphaeraceae bacterium]